MKTFLANLRTAFNYGLTENGALNALTKTPATLLGVYDQVGSLDAGKWANFLITSGPVFSEKTTIYQNWIQGKKFGVKDDQWNDLKGKYKLVLNTASGPVNYVVDFKNNTAASIIGKDTVTSKFYYDGRQVRINFAPERRGEPFSLSGVVNNEVWTGYGTDTAGKSLTWTATFDQASTAKTDSASRPKG
jgi:hypothetical protein